MGRTYLSDVVFLIHADSKAMVILREAVLCDLVDETNDL